MKYNLSALICGTLAFAGLICPATESIAQGASVPQTTIRLNAQINRGAISPFIYGTNHRYNGDATGTWDAVNKCMKPVFTRNHSEAGLKSMRYPGGTVASTFEWKNAIGPLANRRNVVPAKGEPQIATFGVDEAARWCAENGVELVYMYGIGAPNSNPQDAADLVEYLNAPVGRNSNGGIDWAKVRADNGHPEPYNIRFFEIANEADGPNYVQRYWLDAIDTEENRAKRKLPMYPQRISYTPEYCFGGTILLDKQPIVESDDFRESASKSNGKPNQRKLFRYYPILPGSETIFVGNETWQRVSDITKATGNVYQVDAATGTVLFGNGTNGIIPPAGKDILASYRAHRPGFVDYYPVMKAIDPNISIFAGYESSNLVTTMGDKHLYDGVVVHPYTNEWNVPKANTMDEWFLHLMLSSARLGHEIRTYQDLIDSTVAPSRRGKVKVICTEYGPNRQDQMLPDNVPHKATYTFLSVGLYDATQLMNWMRVGMPHAERHCTTVGVFGPPPLFEPSPSAMAFQLFSKHFGNQLIGLDIQNNPMRPTNTVVTGSRYYGNIKRSGAPDAAANAELLKLPKLEVEASRDADGNVYLMVVNQDVSDNVTTNVQIDNIITNGEVEVYTLNGPNANAFNTPNKPKDVKIESSSAPFQGGKLRYVFPAHSLTSIKFNRVVK